MMMQRRRKKGQILYMAGRDDQIATSAKFLDITHDSYGFNADLMNINVVRPVSVW